MKYILFLVIQFGGAPVIPEHYVMTSAEFDDLAACQYAGNEFSKMRRGIVNWTCAPKASIK